MSDAPALRASDAERERAVERLRAASAAGRLTLEELSERVAAAYDARTHDEREQLVRDLPDATEPGTAVTARRRATRILFSLFGSTEREGRIRVRRRVTCLTAFGNIDLDLRRATLEGDVITIVAIGAFAALDVYVPEGVEVDFAGSRSSATRGPAATTRRREPGRRSSASSRSRSGPAWTSGACRWRGGSGR